MEQEAQYCRNCGSPVRGEYCCQCGQREGRADRRFLDLMGDLGSDALDLDSRFWRTLVCLLFRPGFLSAEFIIGRRARYLPPLRLYLIISFIVFLVMSLDSLLQLDPVENARQLDAGGVVAGAEAGVSGDDGAGKGDDFSLDLGIADQSSPPWLQDAQRRLERNTARLRDHPDRFVSVMLDYLPQMMFVLLPVFALLIQFLYLGSAFHYLQHLVFSLHYHAFVYLLYLLAQLIELLLASLDGWLLLGLLVYLPLALRRTYGSGWTGALGKSLLLYSSYAVILVVGFAVVALLALFQL